MSLASRFAHLLGSPLKADTASPTAAPAPVASPAPAAAKGGKKAEDDKKDPDTAKKHGEDERDPERMENESDEEYGKRCDDARKGKKAEKEKEEDDDDVEDDDKHAELSGKGELVAARDRERERCAAILSHPKAAVNLAMALSLAFDTRMTRKEACAVMDKVSVAAPAAPAATTSRSQLQERLNAEGQPPVVKPAAETPPADTAAARANAALAAAESFRFKTA